MRRVLLIVAVLGTTAGMLPIQTANATFSGSNGRISFTRFIGANDGSELFSAAANGSDVQQLTDSPGDRSAVFSDWSPDGNTIAFDSDRVDGGGLDDVVQVYLMPWNGESHGLVQVTTGEGFHGDPAWSPDGRSLALESDWNNYPADEGIWIVPAQAGVTKADAQRVTTIPAGYEGDSEPQFSPDGHWLVFTRYRACTFNPHEGVQSGVGCSQAIFKVRTDGSQLTQLTAWGRENSAPDWSPDGTQITFDSGDLGEQGSAGNVWVMNSDGSHQRRLTQNRPVHGGPNNFSFPLGNNPVWSPDGTKIMYTQWQNDGSTTLDVINADGTGHAVVVSGGFFQNKVDWGTHS